MKQFESILKEKKIKNIIFDFDGVILDSIPVKTEAFKELFENFDKKKVEAFISYHLANGGVSRYKKITYFFNKILGRKVSEKDILEYATIYSQLTKKELTNKKYLIKAVFDFIKYNHQKYAQHIASGADEKDLTYICKKMDLNRYFISINGSPTEKSRIVKNILIKYGYEKEKTILIGDSINDNIAADDNKINFYYFINQQERKKIYEH